MSTPSTLVNPSRTYDFKKFPMMAPQGPAMPVTETYVSVPPAAWIREEMPDGTMAVWTLGHDYSPAAWLSGKWEFDIVRNGVKTGEYGRTIEQCVNSYGTRVIRIYGSEGWRTWSNGRFV